ncbi:MAG: Mu transposase C-terminal domain-containing protein [Candidatus Sericytochromatia bacterium]|nr:Mu transposase C-terminal domain-containing protein [Candidatus Sericytochromatia bacterium]
MFRAAQLRRMAARLQIQIVFATPYSPEGKGKIERYFGTVKGIFFPEAQAADIQTLDELNRFFWAWLDTHYQRRTHSETRQTPLDRWEAGRQDVRFPTPDELRDTFLWEDERWVRKTGTIVLARNEYPVDPQLIGQRVIVRFDPFDLSAIHIVHRGVRIATVGPQALVSRTFNKAQPHVKTAPKQLASAQAFKDRLVAESDTERAAWGALTDHPAPGQLTQSDLLNLLSTRLGQTWTGDGQYLVGTFWSRHAPLKTDLAEAALATAIASKGVDRHLDFYLEAIRAAHWGGEA